jgi:hypothetical protein
MASRTESLSGSAVAVAACGTVREETGGFGALLAEAKTNTKAATEIVAPITSLLHLGVHSTSSDSPTFDSVTLAAI